MRLDKQNGTLYLKPGEKIKVLGMPGRAYVVLECMDQGDVMNNTSYDRG